MYRDEVTERHNVVESLSRLSGTSVTFFMHKDSSSRRNGDSCISPSSYSFHSLTLFSYEMNHKKVEDSAGGAVAGENPGKS